MAEETLTDDVGTGTAAPVVEGAESSPGNGTDEATLIMGKYESQADLEAAFKSVQAEATRAEQNVADMQRKLEIQESQANLATQIADVIDKRQPTGMTLEQIEAQAQAQAELLEGEGGGRAMVDFVTQSHQEANRVAAEEAKALRVEMAAMQASIVERMQATDAVYLQNKDAIDGFAQKHELPLGKAIDMFKDLPAPAPTVEDGDPNPASTANGRHSLPAVAAQAVTRGGEVTTVESQNKELADLGFSAEEIAASAARGKGRK